MIYIYRPAASVSARELAIAVDGIRIRQEVNLRRRVKANDKVIMWGAYLPDMTGRVLNNVPFSNKYEDAVRLHEAGIRTVEVSRTLPMISYQEAAPDPLIPAWETAQEMAEAFANLSPQRTPVALTGVGQLRDQLYTVMQLANTPAPVSIQSRPQEGWLPRRFNHVGGNDLLNGTDAPQYFSKREQFVAEYRVHSFLGRSIRAGVKVPREGVPQHEWVRSYNGGWMISYSDESGIRQRHRDIAHAAVRALGLSFGAVDIGELADGTLVVLEVNRAAGIEAGTTEAYSRAVRRWVSGEWNEAEAN